MRDDPRPIPTRFFPAARLGLGAGIVLAFAVAAAAKSHPVPVAPAAPVRDLVPEGPPPPSTFTATQPQPPRLTGPAVVNVWLQGCADCMPAFKAWSEEYARGAFSGMRIENVAYGRADAEW